MIMFLISFWFAIWFGSGFNAIVSKVGPSIHAIGGKKLLGLPKVEPVLEESPVEAAYPFLPPLLPLIPVRDRRVPASTLLAEVQRANRFAVNRNPYTSLAYGFNANGRLF